MRGASAKRVALDAVLGRLDDRLAGDARARHLGDGVEQQPARRIGVTGIVERRRPGLMAMAKVALHAGQARRRDRLDAELLEPVEDELLDRVAGASEACSAASERTRRSARPSAAPRNEAKSSRSGDGCRCGANSGRRRRADAGGGRESADRSRRPGRGSTPRRAPRCAPAGAAPPACRSRRRELAIEAALEVLGDDGALRVVALVDERQANACRRRRRSAGSRPR